MSRVKINVPELFAEDRTAKLSRLEEYKSRCLELSGHGTDVVMTGPGPIWLYLSLAHVLHGRVRSLSYLSPVTGEVLIFDHNPF